VTIASERLEITEGGIVLAMDPVCCVPTLLLCFGLADPFTSPLFISLFRPVFSFLSIDYGKLNLSSITSPILYSPNFATAGNPCVC
jgi:hypothetical protein